MQPTFGEETLTAGFAPDPHSIELVAGGPINARETIDCAGYIADAPDFRLRYVAGDLPLIVSVRSDGDTTLVIRTPSGDWICDDDSGGSLNPLVTISDPSSGPYDIWVGDFDGNSPSATLLISEMAGGAVVVDPALPAAPDYALGTTFGEVNLSSGFAPTPHSVAIVAGGALDASVVGGDCRGAIAEAPDYRLNFESGGLPLVISATSNNDTTLVIRDPDGDWVCDDDSGDSLNPQVTITEPQPGRYDIWVGTFGGGTAEASLNIAEIGGLPAKGRTPPLVPMPALCPPPRRLSSIPAFRLYTAM